MVSIKYASNSKEIGIAHLCRRAFYSSHVCPESKFPQLKRCRRQGGRLRAPWWIMQKCPWVFKRLALDLLQGMITVWDFSNSIIHCIIMVLFLHLFFFCLESLTTMSHQTHSHILLFKLYSSTWDLWTPCFKHPQRRLTVHIPPQNLLCDHLQG